MSSSYVKPSAESQAAARKHYNQQAANHRAAEIRMIADSELPGVCSPSELTSERGRRWYYGQMNQAELEKQAAYDPDAEAELKRRNGELPR